MLIASALGLVIPASYVDSKVNVPITALIALVAMLAGAVLGAWRLKSQGEDAAMVLQRRFLVWSSAAFLLTLAGVLILYLH